MKENIRISKKYTYIKKLLADTIPENHRFDNLYDLYFSLTETAISNSESMKLSTHNDDLINNVGTSVGSLFKIII